MNLEKIAADIRHVTEILKTDNDAADIRRLDLLQADMESLMAIDMDAVIERVVKARNAVWGRA